MCKGPPEIYKPRGVVPKLRSLHTIITHYHVSHGLDVLRPKDSTVRGSPNLIQFHITNGVMHGNHTTLAVSKRDYALDRIHPQRIRSVEEWLRFQDEKG